MMSLSAFQGGSIPGETFHTRHGKTFQIQKFNGSRFEIEHRADLTIMPVQRAGIDEGSAANISNHGLVGMPADDEVILFRRQELLKAEIRFKCIAFIKWAHGGHVVVAEPMTEQELTLRGFKG